MGAPLLSTGQEILTFVLYWGSNPHPNLPSPQSLIPNKEFNVLFRFVIVEQLLVLGLGKIITCTTRMVTSDQE